MSDATFPFDTCEKPNKIPGEIAQPCSAFVTLISCIIIFFYLVQAKTFPTLVLLSSFLLFQLSHCFSHTIHLPGYMQLDTVHGMVYVMNMAILYAFSNYTGVFPSAMFTSWLVALVAFDIYGFMYLPFIAYLFSQSAIFVSTLLYYYPLFSNTIRVNIQYICALVVVVIGLVINEKLNCKELLRQYPNIPFHVMIESVGALIFYIICSTFYRM